ncbi:hypothetical protein BH23CHL6_BH23CHL6_06920 [soil metagenome]
MQATAIEGVARVRPVRIYVTGFYSWRNKGDAALLLTLDRELRHLLPGAEIRCSSKTPDEDEQRLGVPFVAQRLTGRGLPGRILVSHFLRRRLGRPGAACAAVAVTALMSGLAALGRLVRDVGGRRSALGRLLPPGSLGRLADDIAWADVVLAAPGGYLLAPSPADVGWQYTAAPLLLAGALGKPVVMAHCSLGPFSGVQRHTGRAVVRSSRLLVTREHFSTELALGLGAPANTVVTATDLAWLFDRSQASLREHWPDPVPGPPVNGVGPLVAVSVRSYDLAGDPRPDRAAQRYRQAVARTVDHVVRAHRARVVFVPHSVAGRESDLEVSRAIHNMMAEAGSATVLEADLSPAALQDVYAACEIVIATRAHAAILALACGTPVVAISYGPKTTGLMADLGLERFVVPIDAVTDELLIERASEVLAELDLVRQQIGNGLPEMRLRASRGMAELVEAITAAAPMGGRAAE